MWIILFLSFSIRIIFPIVFGLLLLFAFSCLEGSLGLCIWGCAMSLNLVLLTCGPSSSWIRRNQGSMSLSCLSNHGSSILYGLSLMLISLLRLLFPSNRWMIVGVPLLSFGNCNWFGLCRLCCLGWLVGVRKFLLNPQFCHYVVLCFSSLQIKIYWFILVVTSYLPDESFGVFL